ncbi:MAG: hypothetical protein WKG01_27850 [Kofleriaceae bacterium]
MVSLKLAVVRDVSVPVPFSCPKCDMACSPHGPCPRCGLAAHRMKTFVRREQTVDDTLAQAWHAAVQGWNISARHDELLRLTTRHDAWAWTAARYREHASKGLGGEMATTQLKRLERGIVVSAFSRIQATTDKSPRPYRAAVATLVLLIVVLVGGFVYGKAVKKTGTRMPTSAAKHVGGAR